MVNSIAAALAFFGAAVSASSLPAGQAKVVNSCSYDVYLCNVPAAGGGQVEEDKTLSSGDSWSQTYTELTNGQGWSIKLSNSTSLASILQYEYTFHNDGTIWFDLSCVNGDPWPANWEITADNGCDPKQTAYRYPTDDDYGMQSCDQDASVTVTLCAAEASGSSSATAPAYSSATSVASAPASSSSAQAPAYTSSSQAPASTSVAATTPASSTAEAPAPSTPATTSQSHGGWGGFHNNGNGYVQANEVNNAPAVVTPTTLATSTSAVVSEDSQGAMVTVVEVVTAEATEIVTAYGRHRRHEHHAHQHHA